MKIQVPTSFGTLYSIATPIGHLEDISYRAINILQSVDAIACEDTRETKKLLSHYDISAPLYSYHAQSSLHREKELLDLLSSGKTLALVSDRGTPGISDPGRRLIQKAIEQQIPVVPIPGASAVLTALQASGAQTASFWFRGFIPHKKGRHTFLHTSIAHHGTVVFYESPHRILKCLQQSIDAHIDNRPIVVARELTKIHEEFLRGTAQSVYTELAGRASVQGEFVVIFDAVSEN